MGTELSRLFSVVPTRQCLAVGVLDPALLCTARATGPVQASWRPQLYAVWSWVRPAGSSSLLSVSPPV